MLAWPAITEGTEPLLRAQLIISAFRNIAPFFKMYAHYSGNYAGVTQVRTRSLSVGVTQPLPRGIGIVGRVHHTMRNGGRIIP